MRWIRRMTWERQELMSSNSNKRAGSSRVLTNKNNHGLKARRPTSISKGSLSCQQRLSMQKWFSARYKSSSRPCTGLFWDFTCRLSNLASWTSLLRIWLNLWHPWRSMRSWVHGSSNYAVLAQEKTKRCSLVRSSSSQVFCLSKLESESSLHAIPQASLSVF